MSAKMFITYLSVFGSFLVVVFASELKHGSSIKNVELIAKPWRVKVGEPIQLYCNYDLDGVGLHSVKFYHKQKEFFRYTPAENSCFEAFPSSNFKVKQRGISIEVEPLDEEAGGIYHCEVSSDAPAFETAIAQRNIAVIPAEPEITESSTSKFAELIVTPRDPSVGQLVTMQCIYDIGEEELSSITFFKDGVEFHKFLPADHFSKQRFLSYSDVVNVEGNLVEFRPRNLNSSGIYRCEVNTGAPHFKSRADYQRVTILPQSEENLAESEGSFVELKIIPLRPVVGKPIKLEWTYDVGSDEVDSIRIFKDDQEFYRYCPNVIPSTYTYLVPSISVEMSSSGNTSLVLPSVTLNSSGTYRCEVTTEPPNVRILTVEKNVTIEAKPQQIEEKIATPKRPFAQLNVTPTRPVVGESVELEWKYDVGYERVYWIKIYKDEHEFYRYLPNDSPSMVLFPVPGVTVEPSSPSNTSIVLSSVTVETSGVYTCEVLTEGPSFRTVRTTKHIEIQ